MLHSHNASLSSEGSINYHKIVTLGRTRMRDDTHTLIERHLLLSLLQLLM